MTQVAADGLLHDNAGVGGGRSRLSGQAGLRQAFESGKYFEIYEKWFGPKGELPYPMTPDVKKFLLSQIGK